MLGMEKEMQIPRDTIPGRIVIHLSSYIIEV